MIKKRCGVNLGKEILDEAKQIFGVYDFWRKITSINKAVKKATQRRWEATKNRIIIVEIEAVNGLTSWLRGNGIKVVVNPTDEEMRKNIVSTYPCFFLFTVEEYAKRQLSEDFQKIIKKLPRLVDLSAINQNSHLSLEETLSAFSEASELPDCVKYGMEIKESSMVNLVIFLILLRNIQQFCCEALYCTEEKIKKCKECLSRFSKVKQEFFNLIRTDGIYYPLSMYMKYQFPLKNHYVNLSSYVKEFASPLELAIFLHDSYQMGIAIYPGFGNPTDIEDRPDAYLLDYIYPLEKTIGPEHVSTLIFLDALKKTYTKNFLESIKNKIWALPSGNSVAELLLGYEAEMNRCYDLWEFYKDDILALYSIWKLKKIFEYLYTVTKEGLCKANSLRVRALIEKIHSFLYEYKDFHEYDLALEFGIGSNLIKEFFRNINEIARNKNKVIAFELLLSLFMDRIHEKLKTTMMTYANRKIATSQIWEKISTILKDLEDMNSHAMLESLSYIIPLFDYPVSNIDERIVLLRLLRNKRCEQTIEIVNFLKKMIMDEIIKNPTLSIEIDGLVNQWETGNPLNFFKYKIQEKIECDEFDSEIFEKAFNAFCSINTLKLFKRNPERFFDYQYTLDRYVGLQMKKSGKYHFDYFQPITSCFDEVKKILNKNKKVILLIFDGLGFIHSYFACLEISRKDSKPLAEFSEQIIEAFKKKTAYILSSQIPTLTGVNHISLFFNENLLYDDSFLLRVTDDAFMPDKGDDKAKVFNILDMSEQDRKSTIWRLRLEDSNIQKSTNLWNKMLGDSFKKGILVSTNSEKTFLSYLLKGNIDFKQVDSYTSAIDEAFLDRTHDLVVSQVNLMDSFLHELNTRYPPAFFDNVVKGYWEVYIDLWRTILNRISDGLNKLKKGTVVIITADHGLALGKTSEFKEVARMLDSIDGITCFPKHRISEIISEDNMIIGALIPGHTSRRFLSIFLLRKGLAKKEKIKTALEILQQQNEIVFREIKIEENKRNLTIKPDFLIFPINGMCAPLQKKKYYGGIHGGISMCELFIPFIQLEL